MKREWHQHPKDCKPDSHERPIQPGEKYSCPGDPLCAYTELARKQSREEAMPAMARVAKHMKVSLNPGQTMKKYWEWLYTIVCAADDSEVFEPVENFDWPDNVEGAKHLKYVGPS